MHELDMGKVHEGVGNQFVIAMYLNDALGGREARVEIDTAAVGAEQGHAKDLAVGRAHGCGMAAAAGTAKPRTTAGRAAMLRYQRKTLGKSCSETACQA